jgi:hypothetical protein
MGIAAGDDEEAVCSKVRLVTSLHKNKGLRGTRKLEDKKCWMTCIDVEFSYFSCYGTVKDVKVQQVTSSLPVEFDHANMMCMDL